MKAKSFKGKSPEEIKATLALIMADGCKPTLAVVFISIKQDRKAVSEILHNEGIDIIGTTSCGEFINGYYDEGSAVILLLDIKRDSYNILFEDIGDRGIVEGAAKLAQAALRKFKKPAFILLSTGVSEKGEIFAGDALIRVMENEVGQHVNIFGGMAGDDVTFNGNYVFTNGQSSDIGIAALILDEDKISLHGMAISGWIPLGITRTVTKSEGGWLYTIDNQPALEMYFKYLGREKLADDDKYKMFESFGVHYPFQIEGCYYHHKKTIR